MSDSNVLDLDDDCWCQLEDYRLLLIRTIDPTRITPYLRQCRVLSSEDEEQIYNDPSLVIRKRKVGVLLDILQRTGMKGYVAFLESLELDYPQLYQKITGKEPARVFSILVDTVGESGLTEYLMSEVRRLQKQKEEECRRHQEAKKHIAALEDAAKQQQVQEKELQKQQQRVQRLREERDRVWDEARQLKDENYSLMHDLTRLSEEKNCALMANRDLQLSIEKLKHSLMNAESDSRIHRKRTMTLKNAMEQRPSSDTIWKLQREKDLLTARIQELEQSRKEATASGEQEVSRQEMEDYKQHAHTQHQELLNNLYTLRKELQDAEEQRTKHLEDQDVLKLQCEMLQKDSKMYQDRMEDILNQMEQVMKERNKAMATREEYHKEIMQNLQEKDEYRKQIRELREKCDELQVQLLRTEGEVLSLQTQQRRHHSIYQFKSQTSEEEGFIKAKKDLHSGVSRDHCPYVAAPADQGFPQDAKADGETKNTVKEDELPICRPRANFYYRRKRALRAKTTADVNAPCKLDNSSESGNTDTDGL